jgi:hypothetical protein
MIPCSKVHFRSKPSPTNTDIPTQHIAVLTLHLQADKSVWRAEQAQSCNGVAALFCLFCQHCDSPVCISIPCFFEGQKGTELWKPHCKFVETEIVTRLLDRVTCHSSDALPENQKIHVFSMCSFSPIPTIHLRFGLAEFGDVYCTELASEQMSGLFCDKTERIRLFAPELSQIRSVWVSFEWGRSVLIDQSLTITSATSQWRNHSFSRSVRWVSIAPHRSIGLASRICPIVWQLFKMLFTQKYLQRWKNH